MKRRLLFRSLTIFHDVHHDISDDVKHVGPRICNINHIVCTGHHRRVLRVNEPMQYLYEGTREDSVVRSIQPVDHRMPASQFLQNGDNRFKVIQWSHRQSNYLVKFMRVYFHVSIRKQWLHLRTLQQESIVKFSGGLLAHTELDRPPCLPDEGLPPLDVLVVSRRKSVHRHIVCLFLLVGTTNDWRWSIASNPFPPPGMRRRGKTWWKQRELLTERFYLQVAVRSLIYRSNNIYS